MFHISMITKVHVWYIKTNASEFKLMLDHQNLGSCLQIGVCYWNWFFLFLNQDICCGCSKDLSQWDCSFEHPKHMFKLMKIITIFCKKIFYDKFAPRHKSSSNVVCATSKGSDQSANMCRLIRAFASLLNILWLLSYWPTGIWSC